MAGRWSISTARLGAEAAPGAGRDARFRGERIRQRPSRRALSLGRLDRTLRGGARDGAALPERREAGGDHIHQGRHRGDQSRLLCLGGAQAAARRRDRAQRDGAPFQHRAVAFPARAPGRGPALGRCRRRRIARRRRGRLPRSVPRPGSSPSRTCRTCWAPCRRSRRSSARPMPRAVPVLADGCQGAVHEAVDMRDLDIDFYCVTGHKLYGPTVSRALRQALASQIDAPLQRRRRDDPRGRARRPSPMPIRRRASSRHAGRSSRASASPRRSIISAPSTALR